MKCLQSFETLKRLVTEAPVLKYYSCDEPVVLQCDASGTGLGTVLLQSEAFASKTLTRTESNYAQIEKETLAILFGCSRFEQYILGIATLQLQYSFCSWK